MIDRQVICEFEKLCKIPHQPKNETQMSEYLKNRLTELGAKCNIDNMGNLWANIRASNGMEDKPIIALQAHMDMVYATCGDDKQDGTVLTKEIDGWLCTDGKTSLGADCGAGVAVILWLISNPDIVHPELRIIFTVQEEIGLIGASKIPPECVNGVKYFINLDGFSSKNLTVGSAGGMREHFKRKMQTVKSPAGKAYEISINGLSGGHSGFDIDKKRGNAILLMGEILRKLQTKTPFAVEYIKGGEAFNAIPYECNAKIITAVNAQKELEMLANEILNRHKDTDINANINISPCELPEKVWTGEMLNGVLTALGGFANGVYEMHQTLKDTVSDSSNLGMIYENNGELCIDSMIRYLQNDALNALHQSHIMVMAMCGFIGEIKTHYPSWQPKLEGELLKKVKEAHKSIIGGEQNIIIQHVGLEPSYFQAMNKDMECICLGMDIENCHAPNERWKISSIEPFTRLLLKIIQG